MKRLQKCFVLTILFTLLCPLVHAGTVTYVYTDPQGTSLAEADASGNITATFDYRPFGSIALGTAPSGPGYTGHVNDPDTGLVYMQARYYDPAVGRFVSTDPAIPITGNTFDFGRYTYANNNPVANTDPTGEFPVPDDMDDPTKKDELRRNPFTLASGSPASNTAAASNSAASAVVAPAAPISLEPVNVTAPKPVDIPDAGPFVIPVIAVALFVIDANYVHDVIFGKQGCYGAIACSKVSDVPNKGPPGGWVDGNRRSRKYNDKGEPEFDLDKPHQGADYPHVHGWPDGVREHPGRPYSPVDHSQDEPSE